MKSDERDKRALTVKREILTVDLQKDCTTPVEDEVAVEDQVRLYLDKKHCVVFVCSPSQIKELVTGHLLTEGIISDPKEIMRLEIYEGKAYAYLERKESAWTASPLEEKTKTPKGAPSFLLDPRTVFGAVETLNSKTLVFRRTGGTHASALLDKDGNLIAFSEDIGRHNAVDKVIGQAALGGAVFGRTMLASTGRLVSEIVAKAARVGIRVIISISAPTDKGIKVAEDAGLTLIGFARGNRFNVYTHPERIGKP